MAPVAPSVEATALSRRRRCFSYFQYRPTPSAIVDRSVRRRSSSRRSDAVARTPARRSAVRRSRPLRRQGDSASSSSSPVTAPTAGSLNGATSSRSASGAKICRASANTTISNLARATPALSASALPPRGTVTTSTKRRYRARTLERVVCRAVGDHDDLPAGGRVVEAQQVVDPRGEARAFVARGDDDRHSVLRLADADCGLRIVADCGSIRIVDSGIRSPRSAIPISPRSAIRDPQYTGRGLSGPRAGAPGSRRRHTRRPRRRARTAGPCSPHATAFSRTPAVSIASPAPAHPA